MTKDELKHRLTEAIDRRADEIIGVGEQIRRHPELGFKEVKTARLVEETLRALGLPPKTGLAHSGVRAEAAGGQGPGPTFALLGELDALVTCGGRTGVAACRYERSSAPRPLTPRSARQTRTSSSRISSARTSPGARAAARPRHSEPLVHVGGHSSSRSFFCQRAECRLR